MNKEEIYFNTILEIKYFIIKEYKNWLEYYKQYGLNKNMAAEYKKIYLKIEKIMQDNELKGK